MSDDTIVKRENRRLRKENETLRKRLELFDRIDSQDCNDDIQTRLSKQVLHLETEISKLKKENCRLSTTLSETKQQFNSYRMCNHPSYDSDSDY